jgi:hypothetical protein
MENKEIQKLSEKFANTLNDYVLEANKTDRYHAVNDFLTSRDRNGLIKNLLKLEIKELITDFKNKILYNDFSSNDLAYFMQLVRINYKELELNREN